MEQVNQALKLALVSVNLHIKKSFWGNGFFLKWFPNIRFSRIVKEEAITWIKFVMEL